jgi:glycine cleavage system H protein
MSAIPDQESRMRFTPEHEWVSLEGEVATIGITAQAAASLGDIVHLEIREPGTRLAKGDELGVIESVKAASEIYAPIAGTILGGNPAALDDPALINREPLGTGWLARMQPSDPSEIGTLLDADAYHALLAQQGTIA